MKRDYTINPSMIAGQPDVIWSYDNPKDVKYFSESTPLDVSATQCNSSSICLWYVSPLVELSQSPQVQYSLLGEWNKWTAVSQQRFTSIMTDRQNGQATITIQGATGEIIPVIFFHSALSSITVNCSISTTSGGEAKITVTTSNIVCS